jgi:small-conductance mechanosensitive channel
MRPAKPTHVHSWRPYTSFQARLSGKYFCQAPQCFVKIDKEMLMGKLMECLMGHQFIVTPDKINNENYIQCPECTFNGSELTVEAQVAQLRKIAQEQFLKIWDKETEKRKREAEERQEKANREFESRNEQLTEVTASLHRKSTELDRREYKLHQQTDRLRDLVRRAKERARLLRANVEKERKEFREMRQRMGENLKLKAKRAKIALPIDVLAALNDPNTKDENRLTDAIVSAIEESLMVQPNANSPIITTDKL